MSRKNREELPILAAEDGLDIPNCATCIAACCLKNTVLSLNTSEAGMMAEQGVQMRELSKVNPERISLVVARNIIYSKKIVQILAKTHRVSAYVQYTIGAQGYAVILSKVALTALLLEILECLKNQPQMSNALNQIGYS